MVLTCSLVVGNSVSLTVTVLCIPAVFRGLAGFIAGINTGQP